MRKFLPFVLMIALFALALAASASLLVDYVRPAPVFCSEGGGCGALRKTVFAYPLGIPLPVLGMVGLFALASSSVIPGRRARLVQAVLASLAGVVGLVLLATQAALKTLCPYCVVVDGSAVILAGLSLARAARAWEPPVGLVFRSVAAGSLLVAAAVPMAIGFSRKPFVLPTDLPGPIAAEILKTPRGKLTVVDFLDFECPYCRATHAVLGALLRERAAKLRVARKQVPLRMHPHAMDAARAACCAEDLGKGEEVTDALFSADPGDLTPEGCERIAKERGLDPARFHACFQDPKTEARIQGDVAAFHAAHGRGLPMVYIGAQRLDGAQGEDAYRKALDVAMREL